MSTTSPLSETSRRAAARPAPAPVFCFSVAAAAEPGVMPRVLELFAKRNLVPLRWHSDRLPAGQGRGGETLAIDIQVRDLEPELCDYIARCLRQIHGVETVLTSEKGFG
ncbi:MAG: hypothetical protein WD100_14355 [Tistlia sp.]|uniref:hypothetical protein n=1 Tax=Tistlia sp. TaxID=3057121 RepID=UPI0034A59DFF